MVVSEHRLAVAIGLENITVVDTKDAVLVAASNQLNKLNGVVSLLKQKNRPEADTPVKVERPWGYYEVLSRGPGYQMKRIVVKSNGKLSLQYHRHRAEHWIVMKGQVEVTRDDEVFILLANESTFIPLGAVHRLHNPFRNPVTIIEVQTGTYLGEDDIVRIEDVYGRESTGTKPGDCVPSLILAPVLE
jgi:mannose-1-phosphate guanylyltransferase/mannose-6-phosphate isomerase